MKSSYSLDVEAQNVNSSLVDMNKEFRFKGKQFIY